jgi:hypothetical protein
MEQHRRFFTGGKSRSIEIENLEGEKKPKTSAPSSIGLSRKAIGAVLHPILTRSGTFFLLRGCPRLAIMSAG